VPQHRLGLLHGEEEMGKLSGFLEKSPLEHAPSLRDSGDPGRDPIG